MLRVLSRAAASPARHGCRRVSSTVDSSEIDRFAKSAHLWWHESGEYAPLHSMNELRVPLIRDCLAGGVAQNACDPFPLRNVKILDVGCGGGILCEPLARLGADVTGIDAAADSIRAAEIHWSSEESKSGGRDGSHQPGSLTYRCVTAEELAASSSRQTFDAVVSSETIEHVSSAATFVDVCCQLVRPGGSIFFTTLNRTYLSYLLTIVAAEYLFRVVKPGTHDWNKYICPSELESLLHKNSFRTVLTHGMCYDPLTNRWRWSQSHISNYCLHAVHDPQTDVQFRTSAAI